MSAESDTCKCSFLDLEPIGKQEVSVGKRIKRGLFRASDGRCLNADSNGAYTILSKGVPDAFGNGRGGVVVHPVKMTVANGSHGSHVRAARNYGHNRGIRRAARSTALVRVAAVHRSTRRRRQKALGGSPIGIRGAVPGDETERLTGG